MVGGWVSLVLSNGDPTLYNAKNQEHQTEPDRCHFSILGEYFELGQSGTEKNTDGGQQPVSMRFYMQYQRFHFDDILAFE